MALYMEELYEKVKVLNSQFSSLISQDHVIDKINSDIASIKYVDKHTFNMYNEQYTSTLNKFNNYSVKIFSTIENYIDTRASIMNNYNSEINMVDYILKNESPPFELHTDMLYMKNRPDDRECIESITLRTNKLHLDLSHTKITVNNRKCITSNDYVKLNDKDLHNGLFKSSDFVKYLNTNSYELSDVHRDIYTLLKDKATTICTKSFEKKTNEHSLIMYKSELETHLNEYLLDDHMKSYLDMTYFKNDKYVTQNDYIKAQYKCNVLNRNDVLNSIAKNRTKYITQVQAVEYIMFLLNNFYTNNGIAKLIKHENLITYNDLDIIDDCEELLSKRLPNSTLKVKKLYVNGDYDVQVNVIKNKEKSIDSILSVSDDFKINFSDDISLTMNSCNHELNFKEILIGGNKPLTKHECIPDDYKYNVPDMIHTHTSDCITLNQLKDIVNHDEYITKSKFKEYINEQRFVTKSMLNKKSTKTKINEKLNELKDKLVLEKPLTLEEACKIYSMKPKSRKLPLKSQVDRILSRGK